ncbi:hypothetical protein M8J76_004042 [Diaphorina citri]|nr:hypothetical protein M8J76_004042 [Diaphorina citri]
MGPDSILSTEEEAKTVTWLLKMNESGFPVTKEVLIDNVSKLVKKLNRPNPFNNGILGRTWYQNFMTRHPELSARTPQNLTQSRGNVSKENSKQWHGEITQFLEQNDLMEAINDPIRVFNADEAACFLSPKGQKVLVPRGSKNVYSLINNDEKDCLTVLLNANGAGMIAPPLIIFPYERIPQDVVFSIPKSWGVGKSTSGWMTAEVFFEYMYIKRVHSMAQERRSTLPHTFL